MRVSVGYSFGARVGSVGTSRVMDQFGIGFEAGRHVIAEDLELPIRAGEVVCFTGASGSGKSSLLRAAASELSGVVDIGTLELGGRALIDGVMEALEGSGEGKSKVKYQKSKGKSQREKGRSFRGLEGDAFGEGLGLLAMCGLGEARVMLRTPAELSDGQRYRYRLALGIAQRPRWIVADEFTATLDRTLARIVAFNVRRLCERTGIGFLLATTHEDVLEDLAADVHVVCGEGGVEVRRREGGREEASVDAGVKKKDGCRSRGSWRLRRDGRGTGRRLLDGIIEGMGWGSCGS